MPAGPPANDRRVNRWRPVCLRYCLHGGQSMRSTSKLAARVALLLGLGFWLSCTEKNSLSPGDGTPAAIAVSPPTGTLYVGVAMQFVATPIDATGHALTGYSITWSSSDTTIATVNGTGLVSGMGVGTATITAASDGKSGSASVTVSAATPGAFAVGVR